MKTIQTIALSLLFTSLASACNNTPSLVGESNTDVLAYEAKETEMSPSESTEAVTVLAKTSDMIAAAAKAGKAVFLVVFDKAGEDKDKAMAIAKEASAKKPKTIEIIELNTSDAGNSDLVTKYRLAGAPLPLIIVLDKNSIAAGGLILSEATADGLLDIIPSPKYSEVLKALNDQKAVFIVTYKETMAGKAQAISSCNEAAKSVPNGAVVIQLNIDSKTETVLLNNLKVNSLSTEPVIYVINKAGQVTGTLKSDAKVTDLATAATKVIRGGCCPGGGGGCGPK